MKTLTEILNKYGSDKARGPQPKGKRGHCYGSSYENLFSAFDRESNIEILEIGVQFGGSLLAWKDYFPNSTVTGVDIVDVRKHKSNEVTFIKSDVKSPGLLNKLGNSYSIIIDDGSHKLQDVEYVVNNFVGKLRKGGILVIEDCQQPEVWLSRIESLVSDDYDISSIDTRDVPSAPKDDFLIIIEKK